MTAEVLAYLTTDEEGSPAMVFLDRDEALQYCGDGEEPIALIAAPLAAQGKDAA